MWPPLKGIADLFPRNSSEVVPKGRPRGAMKLSRASSYALHAVAFMAAQKDNTRPVASHDIAAARGIPEGFLLKVLKPLVSAKVLLSIRGPNGGYRSARIGGSGDHAGHPPSRGWPDQ